jgi:transcription elongation factor Elf1
MAKVSDTIDCPVCGEEALRQLDTDTNEMMLGCESCGFCAETEIVNYTTTAVPAHGLQAPKGAKQGWRGHG